MLNILKTGASAPSVVPKSASKMQALKKAMAGVAGKLPNQQPKGPVNIKSPTPVALKLQAAVKGAIKGGAAPQGKVLPKALNLMGPSIQSQALRKASLKTK